jgi:hypothetical protein
MYMNSQFVLKLRKPCICKLFYFKQMIPQPTKISINKRGSIQNLSLMHTLFYFITEN